jgi:methionyl-tRNA formyltransferase
MPADIVTENLSSPDCAQALNNSLIPGEMLALSFGARWIINQKMRDDLFRGLVLNAHGARLPNDRGGGGFSWRIMRGDRIGILLLHEMDDGIDTGPIVLSEEYLVPRQIQTPAEHEAHYFHELGRFVCGFLDQVIAGTCHFEAKPQTNFSSTYYPRLHTVTHSWIDCSWPAADIERFILAFDAPYPGARTFWRDQTAVLRDCQLHVGEIGHHPFQAGLIVRNNRKWLTVALSGEHCLLVADARDESGRDLLSEMKEGDRLFTPQSKLDQARMTRAFVGSAGLKTQTYAPPGAS